MRRRRAATIRRYQSYVRDCGQRVIDVYRVAVVCAAELPTANEQSRTRRGGGIPGGSRETHAAYETTADGRRRRRATCNAVRTSCEPAAIYTS